MAEATSLQNLLSNIGLIYESTADSKLENEVLEKKDQELSFLAEYFGTTKTQALLMSVIFTLNYQKGEIDQNELIRHFNCNPVKLLKVTTEFNELFEKQLLQKRKKSARYLKLKFKAATEEFSVNPIVSERILNSQPLPEVLVETVVYNDIFSLLEKLNQLGHQRGEEEITTGDLFDQAEFLLKENTHFPLIDKVRYLGHSIEDRYLFLYNVWKFLDCTFDNSIEPIFKLIYDSARARFTELQSFLAKESNLIKDDWLEIEEARFFGNASMCLTEKALNLLSECDIKVFNNNIDESNENLIHPDTIQYKELIYSPDELQQLELLKKFLDEENFKTSQQRLEEKALAKGVAVLLHGSPGTGKTESVLQIAKATNRNIMKVDISSSRSAWFGESERIIKQVFKDYKAYAKNQKVVPILFFNEADGIIGRRKDLSRFTSEDTENRIQNILLEEIENFEGILIATTNLVNNMDPAFDRRFLFKINFQKPSISSKSQIWKSKMPQLSMDDCALLANMFDFSGGQIDNIVRKNEINEINYGKKVDVNTLIDFCNAETLVHQVGQVPIGFRVN